MTPNVLNSTMLIHMLEIGELRVDEKVPKLDMTTTNVKGRTNIKLSVL